MLADALLFAKPHPRIVADEHILAFYVTHKVLVGDVKGINACLRDEPVVNCHRPARQMTC